MHKKVVVILGHTASGKSEAAIRLAKKFGGEIISADSRQVYRGMDIGTGKVPKSKCKNQNAKLQFKIQKEIYCSQGIPHYLIDIVSPRTDYNIAKFKKQADKIIEDILKRGKLPIICGGTGFWIKAIVDNVKFPKVAPDWKLRKKLNRLSTFQLFEVLKCLDPRRAKFIDRNNKVRLIRAIEIYKALGRVPQLVISNSEQDKNPNYKLPITNYSYLQIGIKISKEKLHENIKRRLKKRFKQGMIKEVKDLHYKEKLSWKKIQSFGLGYYWIPLYLKGKIHPVKSREAGLATPAFNRVNKRELFEKVYKAEKDYAKRQMTWFKKDKKIRWLESHEEIKEESRIFLK